MLMVMKRVKKSVQPGVDLTRVSRTVYFLLGFFALSIIIFDSGNLITREAVIQRWTACSILLVVNTLCWALAGQKNRVESKKAATITLALCSLLFAGFMTYWERGMASSSTILYVIPLLVIATLKNRHGLMAFAALSAGTYAFAAVKYFNDFFNEGYRIQLWGNIVLYSGLIFVSAWFIMIIAGLRHDSE